MLVRLLVLRCCNKNQLFGLMYIARLSLLTHRYTKIKYYIAKIITLLTFKKKSSFFDYVAPKLMISSPFTLFFWNLA